MLRHWQKVFLPAFVLLNGFNTDVHAVSTLSAIDAFKQSWTASALKLQREIDLNAPINEATFIGTHNSYNSKVYRMTPVRYMDPNQTLSIYDQLEMGVRSIELDAHWTTNSYFSKDILLCHGLPSHWGCSAFDRQISEGLQEIQDWLKANPNEVVLLYIERHLDGHEPRLAAKLDAYLGQWIFKPSAVRKNGDSAKSCVSMPTTLTKADVLKAGKQLLIIAKECDGDDPHYVEQDQYLQQWNDFVFAGNGDIEKAPFTFLDSGVDDFTHFPDCAKSTTFSLDLHHTTMWRIFEDRTMLSSIAHPNSANTVDVKTMHELIDCGINWPTMDMLSVNDSRLSAAIWSWAANYPKMGEGQCSIYKKDEGIENVPCNKKRIGFACQDENTHTIKSIPYSGSMANGESICQFFAGKNWHFAMPVNGAEMYALRESVANNKLASVWLNYMADNSGHWIVNHY